ncbi:MAG: hypothetical protein ACRDSF_00150 [Pseudonocardiaceae bacterium]
MAPVIPLQRFDFRELMGEGDINEFSDLINQPPACRVKRNAASANVAVSTAFTNVTWEADPYDPFNMWASGNPTAVTIGYTAHYDILFGIKWPSMGVVVVRGQIVKMPGPVIIAEASTFAQTIAAGTSLQVKCDQYPLTVGDYLIFQVQHDDVTPRALQVTGAGTYASVKFYASGVLGT